MAAMRTAIPFEITRWDRAAHDAGDESVAEVARATLDHESEPPIDPSP